ncbi:multinuclear nonheme iron-dependent oxidase, partial [Pseudomonas aeruginosa]
MQREFVSGAGLGLRRALLEPLGAGDEVRVDFLEVAPENWIGIGGRLGRPFPELAKHLSLPLPRLSLPPRG